MEAPGLGSRIFIGLGVVAFVALCIVTSLQSRNDAEARALLSEENISNLISQSVSTTIQSYDLSLQGVIEGLHEPTLASLDLTLQQLVLFDRAASADFFNEIYVTNKDGDIIRGSRSNAPVALNVAESDFFRTLAKAPFAGMFIGKPFRNVLTKDGWALPLSRRIDNPDGSFGGIVLGSLNLAYFSSVFDNVELGEESAVSILQTDGTMIARRPAIPVTVGFDMHRSTLMKMFGPVTKGSYTSSGIIDGVRRIYRFQQIPNLPLIVSVGITTSYVFQLWWARTMVAFALISFIALMLAVALLLLRRQSLLKKRAESALRASEERYRLLSENSSDAMMLRTTDGTRVFSTSALARLSGYTLEELSRREVEDCVPAEYRQFPSETARMIAAGEKLVKREMPFQRADKSWIWIEARSMPSLDADGTVKGIVTTLRDITERKRLEVELQNNARQMSAFALKDGLTDIGNRRSFDQAIEREWNAAQAAGHDLCVAMIDVDHFKKYNDSFGHLAGDEALKRIATIINSSLRRPSDFGARYGGEEFAIILPHAGRAGASHVAEYIRMRMYLAGIAHPQGIDERITVSIGIAIMCANRHATPIDLIAAADDALYRAKRNGRNCVVWASSANDTDTNRSRIA